MRNIAAVLVGLTLAIAGTTGTVPAAARTLPTCAPLPTTTPTATPVIFVHGWNGGPEMLADLVGSVSSELDGDYTIPARITKATRFRVTSAAVGSLEAVESTSRRVDLASQFVWATAERVCNPISGGVGTRCEDNAEVSGYVRPPAKAGSSGCRSGRPAAGSTSPARRTTRRRTATSR